MTADRLAGAPISWGVSEVPGWGHQLPAARVLAEMAGLGLTATEFGPAGFLPADPAARDILLASAGLRAVGGFLPLVLHDPDHDPLPALRRTARSFAAAGADTVVLAADGGATGYDDRPRLDGSGWRTLCERLTAASEVVARFGLTAALHPHVGTVVERAPEVERVLAESAIPLCLDTGHLMIGGVDPAGLVARMPARIAHVHLKDVDEGLAGQVRAGSLGYAAAVRAGLYRPLGTGDVDIGGIVHGLARADYPGWYVLEQDTVLDAPPVRERPVDEEPVDEGPVDEGPVRDVRTSVEFLRRLMRNAG